uniref:Transketolase n=1 Tax=Brevundimonas diminuta TaxID=293 RepID=G8DNW1_BREDI|nr:transketolase [Brevundimonas diminuta]
MATAAIKTPLRNAPDDNVDWKRVAYLVHLSRALDKMEETRLVPEKEVLYQFSARGHDMGQILLGCRLDNPQDASCGYYRSRPLLLALGVDVADALGSAMGRAGGYSDGRDIGVVFNFPNPNGASALPMCGGVGAQYTPTAGWAQAIEYYRTVVKDPAYDKALAVVLGGDGSVASNGFWAALTIATTQKLPMLFYIEDNGFGISVPSTFQTPGGNIAANLASWKGLKIFSGDGTDPAEAARLVDEATAYVRDERAPAMLRLTVPRLQGHSFQDTQTYKSPEFVESEWARDPLPKLKSYLVPAVLSDAEWDKLEQDAQGAAEAACVEAKARPVSLPEKRDEKTSSSKARCRPKAAWRCTAMSRRPRPRKAGAHRLWGARVIEAMAEQIDAAAPLIVLAGRNYRDPLWPQIERRASVPMEGLGIGQQLAWLSDN